MITRLSCILFLIMILLTACSSMDARVDNTAGMEPPEHLRSECVVGALPEDLKFDRFYEKFCDAGGIPIISSAEVDDLALQQAYYIVMSMLAPVPEIREELVAGGAYFGVIGKDERLTSIPEYSKLDSQYWDRRARGLGGSPWEPLTTAAEENLLCLFNDRYRGESIAVHEFAHTISTRGLGDNYESLLDEFRQIYQSAMDQGLWENTYAGSNIEEYWAEGVQTYFNTNAQSVLGDGVHSRINTRPELADYDPALYDFIEKIFNGYEWTPACP